MKHKVALILIFFSIFSLVCLCSAPVFAGFLHYNYFALEIDPDDSKFPRKIKYLPKGTDYIVSAQVDPARSSEYFGVINLIIENTTQDWITIKNIRLESIVEIQNSNMTILRGAKLLLWHNANLNRRAYEARRKAPISSFVSDVLLDNSINAEIQGLGNAVTMNAAQREIANNSEAKKVQALLPINHFLGGALVIPPGMFEMKWIVINSRNHDQIGFIDTFKLTFDYKKEKNKVLYLQFRIQESGGWQDSIPTSMRKRHIY